MVAIARAYPARVTSNQDYKANSYYPATIPGLTTIAASANNATADIGFVPFFCKFSHTFTGIAFVNSASVNTHKFHMGIYTSVNGIPSALVVDSGELTVGDGSTATLRNVAISAALSANTLYWLAWQSNTDTQSVFAPSVVTYDAMAEIGSFSGALGDALKSYGYFAANTYGALPSTAPTVTGSCDLNNVQYAPLLYLKG